MTDFDIHHEFEVVVTDKTTGAKVTKTARLQNIDYGTDILNHGGGVVEHIWGPPSKFVLSHDGRTMTFTEIFIVKRADPEQSAA